MGLFLKSSPSGRGSFPFPENEVFMTHSQISTDQGRSRRNRLLLGIPLLFLSALLWQGRAWAQTWENPSPAAVNAEFAPLFESVQNFFEQVANPAEGSYNGLENLLKNSPFEENAKEEMIKTLAEKIDGISGQFGSYVSFEPIGLKRIGRDLVVLRYLYKCQNYPLVWYFVFYRPTASEEETAGKTWQIIHLYYDSQLNIPIWESNF